MRYISANYELYADHLAQSLQSAVSMIHISSDLWTSPYRHGMLAVCGQWVDKDYGLRKALLGLLECPKDHSGKSQAGLIADVLKRFGIRRVGYHTGDNATSNNTCLEALSEKLFNEREVSERLCGDFFPVPAKFRLDYLRPCPPPYPLFRPYY
jgi:hypothetical protein